MCTTAAGPSGRNYPHRYSLVSSFQKALVAASPQTLVIGQPFQLRFRNTSVEKQYRSLIDEIYNRYGESMSHLAPKVLRFRLSPSVVSVAVTLLESLPFLLIPVVIILSGDLRFNILFLLPLTWFFKDALRDKEFYHRGTDPLFQADAFSLSTTDSTATCYRGIHTRTLNLEHIRTFRRCTRYYHSHRYCVEAVTLGPPLKFFHVSDQAIIDKIVSELNKFLDRWRAAEGNTPPDTLRLMEDWFEHAFIRVTNKTILPASPQGSFDISIDKSSHSSFTCSRPVRDWEGIIRIRFFLQVIPFSICALIITLLWNNSFIPDLLPSFIWNHTYGFDNVMRASILCAVRVLLVSVCCFCTYWIVTRNGSKLRRKYHFLNQNIETDPGSNIFELNLSVSELVETFLPGNRVINMGNVKSVFIIRDIAIPTSDLGNGRIGHDGVTGTRYHLLLYCGLYRFPCVIHCLTKNECLYLANIVRSTFSHVCDS